MYQNNDTRPQRDRISDAVLRNMLGMGELVGPSPAPSCQNMPTRSSLRLPDGFPLASVYSPTQVFRDLYDLDTALARGTLFKELDLPFLGQTVGKGGSCRG